MADRAPVSNEPVSSRAPRGRRHPRVRAGYRHTDDTGLIYPADERAEVLVAETTEAPEHVARDRMSARLATADERNVLDLTEPAAVLVIHHVVCDSDNRPLGFEEAICPPETWTLKQEYPVHG